jgi:hypothetical protein
MRTSRRLPSLVCLLFLLAVLPGFSQENSQTAGGKPEHADTLANLKKLAAQHREKFWKRKTSL